MKSLILISTLLFSFGASADFVASADETVFQSIVERAGQGALVSVSEVGRFERGTCFGVNGQSTPVSTVLVSLTQEIQGEVITKMAFYFMDGISREIEEGSALALELESYLEDDWRFWSAINEEEGLHFFYDIEDNGNLDGRIELVEDNGQLLMTYRNLIGQNMTFMGSTFRADRNEIIAACTF